MAKELQLSKKMTAILIYGRIPLVFGGMVCAIAVMWMKSPMLYSLGMLLLIISMSFDLIDGWFAARHQPHPVLAHLADRVMDKIIYSVIFPVVAVGMMWRLHSIIEAPSRIELLHAIFVLILSVTVLVRDGFANFMRGISIGKGPEPEPSEYTRLRTIVAAPVGVLLYAHAFFIPESMSTSATSWIAWLANVPIRALFLVEILFLIINFGSIARNCKKYGATCLSELCVDDEPLRRRILSFFPNALTVLNAIMGILAVFFAYHDRIREAYLFLIGAAIFDKLDGALARKLGLTEPLPGQEPRRITVGGFMDDISDSVSFCIVPAWIFYIILSAGTDSTLIDFLIRGIAIIYTLTGITRLIYFTLDKTPIPGFFKGMPTPAAALMVAAPLIMLDQAIKENSSEVGVWMIFCCGLMLLASILMNAYPIRYIHVGKYMDRHPWFGRVSLMVILISTFTPYFGHVSFLHLFLYMLSPLVTRPPEIRAKNSVK